MKNNKILYVVIIILVIGGGVFFFSRGNKLPTSVTSTTDKKIIDQIKNIPHFVFLKTKTPKPDNQLALSKTISANQGGVISLKDSKGVLIKFSIPAGGLSKDTSITLSPLTEVPIENYTSKLGHGVLIEPEGLKFLKPATLTFDFKPWLNTAGLSSGKALKTLNDLPKGAGIVHVDSLKNQVNNAHATKSFYGSKLIASVTSLSSFIPDDLSGANGEAVAESELPTEAADQGVCSQQFLNSATQIIQNAQAVGDDETANGVMGVLQDCGKKAVNDLENKCNDDPTQVRRRDFVNIIQMVQQIGPAEEATRAEKVMNDCRREYTMQGRESIPVDQGTSVYSVGAKLCGFLDEKWEGTETADYTLLVAHDTYTGAITFTLPQGGGDFYMTTAGQGVAGSALTGGGITVPYSGQGNLSFYDGQKLIIVNYQLFGNFNVNAPITVEKNNCESTNKELNQQTGW